MAQIMPFADVELERFCAYGRYLLTKLPKSNRGQPFKLKNEVALKYYRLQKIREGSIQLQKESDAALDPLSEAGKRRDKEERAALSEIVDILNKRFGTDFTDADKFFFNQIEEALVSDETLAQQARSNSIGNFKYGFDELFLAKLIEPMDENQDIFAKILDGAEFGAVVREWMLRRVYGRLNEGGDK